MNNDTVLNAKINKYISENFYKQPSELMAEVNDVFKCNLTKDSIKSRKKRLKQKQPNSLVTSATKELVHASELEVLNLRKALVSLKSDKKILQEKLNAANNLTDMFESFSANLVNVEKPNIPVTVHDDSESTAVMVLSDWHYEENITPESVNGMNEFTMNIANERVKNCFKNSISLINLFRTNTTIKNVVVALLGDFITNSIHDELMAINETSPMEAIVEIYTHLVAGLELLSETFPDVHFTVVCKVGNHSRTTKKVHISTEAGNSLEYLLYYFLAQHFKPNKQFSFVLEKNYLTYFKVYDYTLRFHHGHQVKYNGGVGGITIPVKKAIAQWDKSRKANLDVFGHFHQTVIDKDFICNGSLIGYSPYAVAIKAEYEKPSQTMFLIEKTHGRTLVAPIFLED